MRKLLFFLIPLFCVASTIGSAKKKLKFYAVGFYNQENLFDTNHDEGKDDYEFLPTGSYEWTALKYSHKLRNMARALADMGTDELPSEGCALIGLAEVENANVLNDLISQPALKARSYRYVHIEGSDKRGIDCALLYNPVLFKVIDTKLLPYVYMHEKDSAFFTRGFLIVSGRLAGEPLTVIVCHWPSRYNGSEYRECAAEQVRHIKDSILSTVPKTKILVMGDMNDNPTDRSMTDGLLARAEIGEVKKDEMYNPWYNIFVKDSIGTLSYKGKWNLFDQIVLTPNMLNQGRPKKYSKLKYVRSEVFHRDYLLNSDGTYKGTPKRTTARRVWLDGYSDHLPVVLYLAKKQR